MAVQAFKGFVGGAYQSASWKAAAQRCLNLFYQPDPEKGGVLYGTPGMVLANSLNNYQGTADGSERVLAMMPSPFGLLIVTAGSSTGFGYLRTATGVGIDVNGNAVLTGNLTPGGFLITDNSGSVYLAQAGDQFLMVKSGGISGAVEGALSGVGGFAPVVGIPANPQTCTAVDGYFIAHGPNTSRFYWSAPFDASLWDALDFASAENVNDYIQRVITLERQLYIVGALSCEIWQVVGGDDVFGRVSGTYIPYGTPARDSVATIGQSLFWLAQDVNGGRYVVRVRELSVSRVSTHAIEKQIETYTQIDDAYGFGYQQQGNAFYVLTFPAAKKTWVFDLTTQLWHERSSQDPDTTNGRHETYWSPRCHAYFGNINFVGSNFMTGAAARVYELKLGYSRDETGPIIRTRTAPHVVDNGQYRSVNSIEFLVQPGVGVATGTTPEEVNGYAQLRISKDGGQTFGYQRTTAMGEQGKYKTRTKFNRQGRARDFIAELSISAPVPIAITGALIDVTR